MVKVAFFHKSSLVVFFILMYGPRASLFQFQTSFLPAADVRNQTMRE